MRRPPLPIPTKKGWGRKGGKESLREGLMSFFFNLPNFLTAWTHILWRNCGLHGLWRVTSQSTAYIPGCSPIATTPRGYVRQIHNSGPRHSQQILLSSHTVTHPYSGTPNALKSTTYVRKKESILDLHHSAAFPLLSPMPGN